MNSRARSVKPAWLDDSKTGEASLAARVLSIALLVMADDYGNGRLTKAAHARVFPNDPSLFMPAFEELVQSGFVSSYTVDGQSYFSVTKWAKHQRVDKPGKPLVPGPCDNSRDIRETLANSQESLATSQRGFLPEKEKEKEEDPPKPPRGSEGPKPEPKSEPEPPPGPPRTLADPELLTTFRSALATAGHGAKRVSPAAWRDLSGQWGIWTPDMADEQRHELLRRAVARWCVTGEAAEARYPVSVFLTWAGEQEGLGKARPDLPEHRPAPLPYQLTDDDRAAQSGTGAMLLELLEAS